MFGRSNGGQRVLGALLNNLEVYRMFWQKAKSVRGGVCAAEMENRFDSSTLDRLYSQGTVLRKDYAKKQEPLRRINETELKFRYR
jgi:hypothetical protein